MWAARNAVPAPIPLLAIERLAGAVQRRGRAVAAIGVISAIGGLYVLGVPPRDLFESWPLSVLPARAVLRLVDPAQGEAAAEVRGRAVIVRGPSGERQLDVSPRAVAAARLRAIPTSIAKPLR